MAFLPKIKDRHYECPIFKIKKDGSKGRLISHKCYKCDLQKTNFVWFQSWDGKKWYAVCEDCRPVS